MNNLLFSLKDLKTRFGGEFIITEAVHQELVEHPMQTKRFKFEALQVLKVIKEGTITVYKNEQLGPLTQDLLSKANASCLAHHHPMQIVSLGEIEALAATIILKGEALVVDERTTRLLVEDPAALALHMSKKLHTTVKLDQAALGSFRSQTKDVKIIRSTELALIAYEKGLLDPFLGDYPRSTLIEAFLWGLKLNGCAISEEEILRLIATETALPTGKSTS